MDEIGYSAHVGPFSARVVTREPARVVLDLTGELDVAGVQHLREVLADVDTTEVVLGMSEVTFIDSYGLRDLLVLARQGRVILRNPSQAVERLIDIVGLGDAFEIEIAT